MSTEDNKNLIRRAFEAQNQGDDDAVLQYCDPDIVFHEPSLPTPLRGHEAFRQLLAMYRGGFPDFRFTEEDMIAEGDKVAARWRIDLTHKGEFLGIPPTGKQLTISSIDVFRIVNGKIVEQWVLADTLGMMQQLGVIPAPEQVGT
jgi:steroid delta-isomerase-like uncharacterized protein